ncbi:MAG: hypothetical protein KIT73_13755 [Burkholderiales bacterium]|nr:hypothetical protein [Burkholderiales bacterium]
MAGLLLASLIASAVFTSFYFSVRAARTGMDMEGRLEHWRHSASLLHTDADLWLGIGAGRFPEAYFWNVPQGLFPGTWEIRSESDNDFLRLGPPRHMRGFGDLFRVSQTVPLDVRGPFIIQFRARAAGKTYARVEICRKHLLYTDDCVIHGTELEGGTDWQTFKAVTEPGDLNRGPWYAPRLAVLSLDLDGGSAADIDDLSVIDGNGHQIVRNGSFQAGPDHWFFTSDRLHLAWHAKNLMLHVLIEHGILGLIALGIACLVALLRLLVAARHGPRLALPVLAGVTGILTVGLFDSVLNVPRITVWFAILLWIALTIRIRMPANTPA